MKTMSRGLIIGVGLLMTMLASCATQPSPTAIDPPGFFMGIIHGFLVIPAFFMSIFTDVRIYAFPNSVLGYDLGFFLAFLIQAGRTDEL